jgi:hypothetical protein
MSHSASGLAPVKYETELVRLFYHHGGGMGYRRYGFRRINRLPTRLACLKF